MAERLRPRPHSLRARALDAGLLVLSCGADKNVLRLMPPTTLTMAEADTALAIITAALQDSLTVA